jgi:hypothetical protein
MKASEYYQKRQLEIVQFSERVYHECLRHKALNGALYEDMIINYLRKDVPEYCFYKGQINEGDQQISEQFDVIVCKKGTEQPFFLKNINPYIAPVKMNQALAVIEIKKWGQPSMIRRSGSINQACDKFKSQYPKLKYFFLSIRFKDRKNTISNNWEQLQKELKTDGSFCFYGNVDDDAPEWDFPWRAEIIERHKRFFGQYEALITTLEKLT